MIVQPGKKEYEKSRTDVTFEDHVSINPISFERFSFKAVKQIILKSFEQCPE